MSRVRSPITQRSATCKNLLVIEQLLPKSIQGASAGKLPGCFNPFHWPNSFYISRRCDIRARFPERHSREERSAELVLSSLGTKANEFMTTNYVHPCRLKG